MDAFVLASPNHTHAAILEDLIDAGPGRSSRRSRSSPISTKAARLEERAARAGAPIWVAMEYRYMPGVSTLIEDLRAGRAGRLRMVSIVERRFPFLRKVGDWNRFNRFTGGTLVEKCCHFFDLMRLLTGSEPAVIHAIGGQALNHLDEVYPQGRPDVLDHAFVTVTFENGVKAMLELCMFAEGSHFQERVSVIGERATLEARVPGPGRFEAERARQARGIRDRRARDAGWRRRASSRSIPRCSRRETTTARPSTSTGCFARMVRRRRRAGGEPARRRRRRRHGARCAGGDRDRAAGGDRADARVLRRPRSPSGEPLEQARHRLPRRGSLWPASLSCAR